MAVRARLTPPRPDRPEWRWHQTKWASLPASALARGDRRLEAENYLSSGFGIRAAIEARREGLTTIASIARVWAPSRLKGIQVAADCGTPFLAATQVFDQRPIPRKWLSLQRTQDATNRFVMPGLILLTCSGNVGRATVAHEPHAGLLISHDLLRVEQTEQKWWGWLYAYLRADNVRAMMTASRYGHIIKHLEPAHVEALPIPHVKDALLVEFQKRVTKIVELRNTGYRRALSAETNFENGVGALSPIDVGEGGFWLKASTLASGRRRMDSHFHNPFAAKVRQHLSRAGVRVDSLSALGLQVWLPSRFKRVPADEGVELLGSSDLFEVSPDRGKRITDGGFGDPFSGRVERGWLLLARSGQIYGVNGSLTMSTAAHEGKIISDHVIRIAPTRGTTIRIGYLLVALSHPVLGRPLVKALAYGSSIPEIEVADVNALGVVRLQKSEEDAIATFAEESSRAWAQADLLEGEIATEAGEIVARFANGDRSMLTV